MVSPFGLHVESKLNSDNRPELLDVSPQTRQKSELDSEEKEHRDERQILLDTDRSFVLYPVGEPIPHP